jgi:hypothetical protein
MKNITLKFILLFLGFCSILNAQNKSNVAKYPETFTVSKNEYNSLFNYKENSTVKLKTNKYLNGALVILNQKVIDNKQLRLKLKELKNAELVIQVNGSDTVIIFVLVEGQDISYKTIIGDKEIKFIKGKKDEILSE